MQPQSNPNLAGTSRDHESRFSHPMFHMNTNIPTITNDGGHAMKPPLFLAPLENRRATLNLDKAIEYELKYGRKLDPTMDRKKLRR